MRLGYLFAALTFVLPATAAELYTITYTRTDPTQQIQSFMFSFTEPTFITTSGVLPVNQFNVSDSMGNTFTMTQGRVDVFSSFIPPNFCLSFAANGATLANCGETPNTVSFIFAQFSGIPMATGMYTPTVFGGEFGNILADQIFSSAGTFTLTISDVVVSAAPEPSSIFLTITGLAGVAWMMQRRARAVRKQGDTCEPVDGCW